jgi:hypothetical protein
MMPWEQLKEEELNWSGRGWRWLAEGSDLLWHCWTLREGGLLAGKGTRSEPSEGEEIED